jgi:hypothetical protein
MACSPSPTTLRCTGEPDWRDIRRCWSLRTLELTTAAVGWDYERDARGTTSWWISFPRMRVQPALELIRGRVAQHGGQGRELPFFASFEAGPDLAERAEEILSAELGR